MQLKLRIAANTAAQVVGKIVSAGVNFIITILLARQLGVEGYGELTKILTFTAFFYLAADFGLNAVTVKKLSSKDKTARNKEHIKRLAFDKVENTGPSEESRILQTLFTTRVIMGLVFAWLAVMATVFLPYSPETGEGFSRIVKLGIIIFAPTILLQALIRSTNAYFQHKLRYDKATIAVAAGSLISLLSVASMVYLNITSLLVYVAFLLFAITIHTLTALFLLKRLSKLSLIPFQLHVQKIFALLKQSAPLGLTLILNIAFFRLDTFLLAVFRSSAEVGLYGLAYKFFEFPLTLPTFFMNALYPILSNLEPRTSNADEIRFKSLIKKSSIFLSVSSIILIVILWFIAPYIILIKSEFAGSIVLFRLLILWLPLFFLSSLFMWTWIAKEESHWRLVFVYAAGLVFNAIANLIFIPSYGAPAAALTTGATELLILVLLLFQR